MQHRKFSVNYSHNLEEENEHLGGMLENSKHLVAINISMFCKKNRHHLLAVKPMVSTNIATLGLEESPVG